MLAHSSITSFRSPPRFLWGGSTSKVPAWLSRAWNGRGSRRTWKSSTGNWMMKTVSRLVRYRNTRGSEWRGCLAPKAPPAWILPCLISWKCSWILHLVDAAVFWKIGGAGCLIHPESYRAILSLWIVGTLRKTNENMATHYIVRMAGGLESLLIALVVRNDYVVSR